MVGKRLFQRKRLLTINTTGGAFSDSNASWRWIFYISKYFAQTTLSFCNCVVNYRYIDIPPGIVAIIIIGTLLRLPSKNESVTEKLKRFDLWGYVALTITLAGFVAMADNVT